MAIHFWNTDKLIKRLADDNVSEIETMRYAMIGAGLYSFAIYYALLAGTYRSWLLLYEFICVLLISVIGVAECFKANGGPLGRDFLKRFTVISIPVGIKLFLAGLFFGIVGYFGFSYVVTPQSFRNPAFVFELYSFAFAALFMFVYYWRIATHLSRLQLQQSSNTALQGTLRDEAAQRP
ncbi:MAG: hypothetical protein ROZ00_15930 [Denitratisoma sp.]|nr:hypothetical protein [Denitratisoma sp.]